MQETSELLWPMKKRWGNINLGPDRVWGMGVSALVSLYDWVSEERQICGESYLTTVKYRGERHTCPPVLPSQSSLILFPRSLALNLSPGAMLELKALHRIEMTEWKYGQYKIVVQILPLPCQAVSHTRKRERERNTNTVAKQKRRTLSSLHYGPDVKPTFRLVSHQDLSHARSTRNFLTCMSLLLSSHTCNGEVNPLVWNVLGVKPGTKISIMELL